MKHLKLRARLIPNSKEAIVTVVEQTHGGGAFSDPYFDFFVHKGYRVSSNRSYVVCMGANTLWLSDGPGVEFKIQQLQWPKIKQLVEAYNEWGATQP